MKHTQMINRQEIELLVVDRPMGIRKTLNNVACLLNDGGLLVSVRGIQRICWVCVAQLRKWCIIRIGCKMESLQFICWTWSDVQSIRSKLNSTLMWTLVAKWVISTKGVGKNDLGLWHYLISPWSQVQILSSPHDKFLGSGGGIHRKYVCLRRFLCLRPAVHVDDLLQMDWR